MFPILSNFSLSYLCSCWLGYLSHHPRLFFFSTQRERKLNGSSLIVALVSLFSFLKETKCIAFHSGRLDVSIVSIVSQLSYGSSRLRSAKTPFRDWVGENDKRSYLKRKCRTLEYSLNARSFNLAGFYEFLQ